jgi:major membrane immunogen (membrane-anchored lipoprotein)
VVDNNDEHPEKQFLGIDEIDCGMMVDVNDEYPQKQ